MTEAVQPTPRTKAKPLPPTSAAAFENPFAMTSFEAPAAFREFAEKGISQAKDGYEKMKSAAEEASSLFESTYASATRGAADYGLKLIEVARTNSNAGFDYASELMGAKSLSEVVELTTAHARKQFETLTTQARELTTLAQKLATESVEPFKDGMTRVVKKVA